MRWNFRLHFEHWCWRKSAPIPLANENCGHCKNDLKQVWRSNAFKN